MSTRRTVRHRGLLLTTTVLAALLLLGGCGEGAPAEQAEKHTGGSSATSSTPSHSDTPSEPTTTDATEGPDGSDSDQAETIATDEPATPATGKACVVGTWRVDNDEFGRLIERAGSMTVDKVTGAVVVTFRPNGSVTTDYDDWTNTITVQGATTTIVRNGVDHGRYQAKPNGTMTMKDTKQGSKVVASMQMAGQSVTVSPPNEPSLFSRATFTCDGDQMKVTVEGASTVLHRAG